MMNFAINHLPKEINIIRSRFQESIKTLLQKKVALVALATLATFATAIVLFISCRARKAVKITPIKIETQSDLEMVLNAHQVDHTKWTKSVADLFKEIKGGECTLALRGKDLVRIVNVVSVRCFIDHEGHRKQLIEKKQVYKTGKVVERKLGYLGEKMKPGEKPADAAIRGVAEELQISESNVKVKAQEKKVTEEKIKGAYAGLHSIYNAYYFAYEMDKQDYKDSYQEVQADKTSYFEWVKI